MYPDKKKNHELNAYWEYERIHIPLHLRYLQGKVEKGIAVVDLRLNVFVEKRTKSIFTKELQVYIVRNIDRIIRIGIICIGSIDK